MLTLEVLIEKLDDCPDRVKQFTLGLLESTKCFETDLEPPEDVAGLLYDWHMGIIDEEIDEIPDFGPSNFPLQTTTFPAIPANVSLVVGGLNGHNYITFDGSLEEGYTSALAALVSPTFGLFHVLRNNAPVADADFRLIMSAASNHQFGRILGNANRGGLAGDVVSGTRVIPSGTWYIVYTEYNVSGTYFQFINGTLDTSGVIATPDLNSLFLGFDNLGVESPWIGGWARTILYDPPPSSAEIVSITNFLAATYGIIL